MSKKGAFQGKSIFIALVALLAGYSAWEFHRTGPDNDTDTEKRLFHFQAADVDELKITGKEENLDVVRDADGWKVKAPYVDLGEPSAMDAVLYSIMIQKGKLFRGEGEKKIDWAEFGFEPPRSTVEVRTKTGSEKIEVSSKNAFDGSFYLRQNGELYLGDKSMAQAVLRDPKTFRSRRLWRDPDADIVSVEVQRGKEFYTLTKAGEDWKIDPPPKFATDKVKISKWVANLTALQPSEVANEELSDQGKRDYLLLKPSVVITAKAKKADGKPAPDWTLTVGQNKAEDVYLKVESLAPVYKTTAASLAALHVGPEYFRDGRTPFKFNVEAAKEIDVRDGDFKHGFVKTDLLWKLKDEPQMELDQDKLIALMQKLGTLDAAEFLPAKAGKGFKPDQRIETRDEKGKILFALQWGDSYSSQGQSLRYVKTSTEPAATLGVPTTQFKQLVDKSMVHKKAEKK